MNGFAPPTDLVPIAQLAGDAAPLGSVDPRLVRAALEEHGALLLRGFDSTIPGFKALAEALCSSSVFNESPNRELLGEGISVQSVNLGNDPFPLHPELSREPWRPDVAMFACFGAPGVGGQTTLCDGIAIAESMPEELRASLLERQLYYMKPASPQLLEFWLGTATPDDDQLATPPQTCPYWFRRAGDRVIRGFIRPVLEPTPFQQRPAFANFLLFARDYLNHPRVPLLDGGEEFPREWLDEIRKVARKLTYAHRWETGDVLIADNHRFMHGRKAIVSADERQIATYFGYLRDFAPRPGEPDDPIWRRETFVPPDTPPEV